MVAAEPAGQVVVALAAGEDIGLARAVIGVIRIPRVGDLDRHLQAVPHRAVGEGDGGDTRLVALDRGAHDHEIVQLAEELVRDTQHVVAIPEGQDQVHAVANRDHVVRHHVGEAQVVDLAEIAVVDEVGAEVATDEVGIATRPAPIGLIATRHVDQVVAIRALHVRRVRCMIDQQRLVERQRVHGGANVDVRLAARAFEERFPSGQHHLEDEALLDRDAAPAHVARPADRVIGVDLPQDAVPLGQVVVARIVAPRQRLEHGLEHGRELAVGRRSVDIAVDVVLNSAREVRQSALQRHAHGERPADRLVVRQHRREQLDHCPDAGRIAALRQAGRAERVDRVIDRAVRLVDRGRQDLRPEIDAHQRGREVQLPRRHDLDPELAVVGRVHLVQRVEVDLVVSQHELARRAVLRLQLERPVEIARPDVESPVAVRDLDRVVHHDPVDLVDADLVHLDGGVRIVAQLLRTPLASIGRGHGEDVVEGRIGDRHAVRADDGGAAGERPRPIVAAHGVIDHGRPPVDDLDEVRGRLAMRERRCPTGGREGLRQLPRLTIRCALRQHVREIRALDGCAVHAPYLRARGQRPVAAGRVLDVDRAVDQPHGTVLQRLGQHGRQLARELQHLAPLVEHRVAERAQVAQLGHRHARGDVVHQRGELEVVGGRDGEIGHPAEAARVDGVRRLPRRGTRLADIARVGVVGLEDRLVDRPPRAVRPRERRALAQERALRRGDVQVLAARVQRGHANIGEGEQLARVRLAVLVEVAPHA